MISAQGSAGQGDKIDSRWRHECVEEGVLNCHNQLLQFLSQHIILILWFGQIPPTSDY